MKTGFYIREVKPTKEFCFYYYDGIALYILRELGNMCLCFNEVDQKLYIKDVVLIDQNFNLFWQKSAHEKPLKKLGFEYCEI